MKRAILLFALFAIAGLGAGAVYFFVTGFDPFALDFVGMSGFYAALAAALFGFIGFFYILFMGKRVDRKQSVHEHDSLAIPFRRTALLTLLVLGFLFLQQSRSFGYLTGGLMFALVLLLDLALPHASEHTHE